MKDHHRLELWTALCTRDRSAQFQAWWSASLRTTDWRQTILHSGAAINRRSPLVLQKTECVGQSSSGETVAYEVHASKNPLPLRTGLTFVEASSHARNIFHRVSVPFVRSGESNPSTALPKPEHTTKASPKSRLTGIQGRILGPWPLCGFRAVFQTGRYCTRSTKSVPAQ